MPRAWTDRHSTASGSVVEVTTSSIGSGGRSTRVDTCSLKSRRSSSRRSCQNPRLIMAMIAAITSRWNAIHRGRKRKPYLTPMAARTVPPVGRYGRARGTRAARLPPPACREDRVDGGDRRVRRRAGPPRRGGRSAAPGVRLHDRVPRPRGVPRGGGVRAHAGGGAGPARPRRRRPPRRHRDPRSTSSSSACSTTTCAAGSARSTSGSGSGGSPRPMPGTAASPSTSCS